MSALLSIYQKYAGLINRHLEGSQNFTSALDSACTRFINANAITQLPSCNQVKSAELIAKYCDLLLRKSSRNADEAEIEEQLTQIMVIFRSVSHAQFHIPAPIGSIHGRIGSIPGPLVPYNGHQFRYHTHQFHIPAAMVPYTGCIGSI